MAPKKTQVKDLAGRSVSSSKASNIKGGAKAKANVKLSSFAKTTAAKSPAARTAAARVSAMRARP
jgi:hypothetical protein